ncbi:MAG: PIN domain-containing protein [Acidimicrobiales bacterium]
MIAIDSSVAVPAVTSWHEFHEIARIAADGASIPAHALLETYSVLTRMPGRLSPTDAGRLLDVRFGDGLVLVPSRDLALSVVRRLAESGLHGGAVYDALIGWTASEHSAPLVTVDARAARNYAAANIAVEFLDLR